MSQFVLVPAQVLSDFAIIHKGTSTGITATVFAARVRSTTGGGGGTPDSQEGGTPSPKIKQFLWKEKDFLK